MTTATASKHGFDITAGSTYLINHGITEVLLVTRVERDRIKVMDQDCSGFWINLASVQCIAAYH